MAERIKRKSFWDIEEEAKHMPGSESNSWSGKEHQSHYDDGRYHGFSVPGTTSVPKSLDNSWGASWESAEESPTVLMSDSFVKRKHDAPEAKEVGGANRYYKNMSPGFDGMERRNYNNTFEDDRSHSHRYPVRGRSRSRGRTSGRSRSRSLSRGRGRERDTERGRGWSRSRSRSNGSARGQTRSRSPLEDYRRQSYGWSDRNRVPDKSSQSCRDFVGGSCRRGSQCRFVHPNNISHRGGDRLENDPTESWRNRADHSRMSKHAYGRCAEVEMQDDISDPYHGKDEKFISKSRSAFPCKDFMRGNCRWGDTCKFFHHVASGDSFGRSSKVRSFDKDIVQQSDQYGKPICKFFAVGKCDRNNCRFSHEDPKANNLGAKGTEVYDQYSLHEKSSWSDDAMRGSNTVSTIGWGDTFVTNTNSTLDSTNGIGQTMENEREFWGLPDWKDKYLNREKQSSPPDESGSHDRDIDTTESTGKDNVDNKQEQNIFLGSQLQNQDEVLNVQQHNTLQEDTNFSIKTLQQNVSSVSQIHQQHQRMVEKNIVDRFVPGVFEGVEGSQNTTHSLLFNGQKLNRNGESIFLGHSSILSETNRGQNVLYPTSSNEIITNLNVPEAKTVTPLNSQDQMLNSQKAIKSPEMLESKALQFFPKLNYENSAQLSKAPAIVPGSQVAPLAENLTTFLAQRFVNEPAQIYQGGELSNSMGMMPSLSDNIVHAPPVNIKTATLNPVTVSTNLFNSMEDGRETNISGPEQNSQMHVKQSSPLTSGTKIDNSKMQDPESENLKQEEVAVEQEDEAHGEQTKDARKNKPSETLDDHGKVEEGNANKDEKGMRIFKNALIEFVKEVLKPTWKEGRMSREVHKTIVKKVVDKVTSTIQVDHIPKTLDKAEHYMSCSKPKITKLVQAYVDRCRKTES